MWWNHVSECIFPTTTTTNLAVLVEARIFVKIVTHDFTHTADDIIGGICLFSASGQNWHVLYKQVCRLLLGLVLLWLPRICHPGCCARFAIVILWQMSCLALSCLWASLARAPNVGLIWDYFVYNPEFLKSYCLWCWHGIFIIVLFLTLKHVLQLLGLLDTFSIDIQTTWFGTAMLLFVSASLVILELEPQNLLSSMVSIMMCLLMALYARLSKNGATFLNPERDPLGTGYHIIQSKIAVGAGGFWGRGWLRHTISFKFSEHTLILFCRGSRRIWLDGLFSFDASYFGHYSTFFSSVSMPMIPLIAWCPEVWVSCSSYLCHQYGHGFRTVAHCRYSIAIDQLWWFQPDDNHDQLWYHHVSPRP